MAIEEDLANALNARKEYREVIINVINARKRSQANKLNDQQSINSVPAPNINNINVHITNYYKELLTLPDLKEQMLLQIDTITSNIKDKIIVRSNDETANILATLDALKLQLEKIDT